MFEKLLQRDVDFTTGSIGQQGHAVIIGISKPDEFTPGVEFSILVQIKNVGDFTDILFMDIYDADTDELLWTLQLPVVKGFTIPFLGVLTLTQTTDFHGRIEAGHLDNGKVVDDTENITINVAQVATSGSAIFQESSAVVGDTLHADFTWLNAQYHSSTFGYAIMELLNPQGTPRASHYEKNNANGSRTLVYDVDMAGTWTAQINIWDGSNWLQYVDTVIVTEDGDEGLAVIIDIIKPDEFTPDVEFSILVQIKNIGDATDILFMDIYDADTDELLWNLQLPVVKGITIPFLGVLTLTQTTDFHGRIDAGHL